MNNIILKKIILAIHIYTFEMDNCGLDVKNCREIHLKYAMLLKWNALQCKSMHWEGLSTLK